MRVVLIQGLIVAYIGILTGCAASAAAEEGVADHQHHADVAVPSPLNNGSFIAEKSLSSSSSSQIHSKKPAINTVPSPTMPAQAVTTTTPMAKPTATPTATPASAATSSAATGDNVGSTSDPTTAGATSDTPGGSSDGLISQ